MVENARKIFYHLLFCFHRGSTQTMRLYEIYRNIDLMIVSIQNSVVTKRGTEGY